MFCGTYFDRHKHWFHFFFFFVCKLERFIKKDEAKTYFSNFSRVKGILYPRLIPQFWKIFGVYNPTLNKHVGPYKIGSINNVNIITIGINPQEPFQKFKDKLINTKTKI